MGRHTQDKAFSIDIKVGFDWDKCITAPISQMIQLKEGTVMQNPNRENTNKYLVFVKTNRIHHAKTNEIAGSAIVVRLVVVLELNERQLLSTAWMSLF